jgi:hypothetical protein
MKNQLVVEHKNQPSFINIRLIVTCIVQLNKLFIFKYLIYQKKNKMIAKKEYSL